MKPVSIPALRRLAVMSQDYAARPRRARADDVEAAISSRAGTYPTGTVPRLLREGRIIEGWAHALCVVPAEDWPLYAWALDRLRRTVGLERVVR